VGARAPALCAHLRQTRPGDRAPTETSATRVSVVALKIVADGVATGEIDTTPTLPVPRAVHTDLARLRDAMAPGTPDEVLGRALLVWTALLGAISYELFGHLHGVIDSYDVFFEHQMQSAAAYLASGPSARID